MSHRMPDGAVGNHQVIASQEDYLKVTASERQGGAPETKGHAKKNNQSR